MVQTHWQTTSWLSAAWQEAMVEEEDAGRCSWLALEKHAAHAAKGGTHLLRSPGRPLLKSPLENLAQILDTEARISAKRGVKEGQRATPAQTEPVQTSTHKHKHQTHGQSGEETTSKERGGQKTSPRVRKVCGGVCQRKKERKKKERTEGFEDCN